MIGRRWMAAPLVAAAIGGPYLANETSWRDSIDAKWEGLYGASSDEASEAVSNIFGDGPVVNSISAGPVLTGEIAGPEVTHFGEVFRFDATPAWIMSRWARVTTRLADLNYDGYRVPLMTGIQLHDLSGTLTYYFNQDATVQRITFTGHTGDPRELSKFVQEKLGFQPAISARSELYLIKWNGTPRCALAISPAAIVRNDQPHRRYEVKLEINRPGAGYGLSETFLRRFKTENGLTFR